MWSVCALAGDCNSCITVFYTNELFSELSGHNPALDCVPHSDLTYTYTKGHFRLKGLILMTDDSCNKFRYRILNDNTAFFFFFLTKEILLKTIMAVHMFGIPSSVWCRAKIFDLYRLHSDLVVRTGRLCMRPFQEKWPDDIWDQHRQDQHAHLRSLCIGAVWSGFTHIANRMHCQPQMSASSVNTALQNGEIVICLCFSHLSSVHFTFEERDFCVSVVAQTRTNVR